jgi:hypothetical protein
VFDDSHSFITRAFLRSEFELDYRAYATEADAELLTRLRDWDRRLVLNETQAEGAFTQTFFVDTWGYGEAGRVAPDRHTIIAKFPVPGEGAGGGAGEADLALGWFRGRKDVVPQVLCEFKDIRSSSTRNRTVRGARAVRSSSASTMSAERAAACLATSRSSRGGASLQT